MPRFAVDGMLGTLARKLRILGYDTAFLPNVDDRELHALSIRENRILLTSDRSLHAFTIKKGGSSILVSAATDEERAALVFHGLRLRPAALAADRSRCPLCNGAAEWCARKEVAGILPVGVFARHAQFYRCTVCRKVYWKGSQWKRLLLFSKRLQRAVEKADKAQVRR